MIFFLFKCKIERAKLAVHRRNIVLIYKLNFGLTNVDIVKINETSMKGDNIISLTACINAQHKNQLWKFLSYFFSLLFTERRKILVHVLQ